MSTERKSTPRFKVLSTEYFTRILEQIKSIEVLQKDDIQTYLDLLKDLIRSNKWYSSKWQRLTTSCLAELMDMHAKLKAKGTLYLLENVFTQLTAQLGQFLIHNKCRAELINSICVPWSAIIPIKNKHQVTYNAVKQNIFIFRQLFRMLCNVGNFFNQLDLLEIIIKYTFKNGIEAKLLNYVAPERHYKRLLNRLLNIVNHIDEESILMINMLNEDFVETKIISYVTPRGNINDETEIHPITIGRKPQDLLLNFNLGTRPSVSCLMSLTTLDPNNTDETSYPFQIYKDEIEKIEIMQLPNTDCFAVKIFLTDCIILENKCIETVTFELNNSIKGRFVKSKAFELFKMISLSTDADVFVCRELNSSPLSFADNSAYFPSGDEMDSDKENFDPNPRIVHKTTVVLHQSKDTVLESSRIIIRNNSHCNSNAATQFKKADESKRLFRDTTNINQSTQQRYKAQANSFQSGSLFSSAQSSTIQPRTTQVQLQPAMSRTNSIRKRINRSDAPPQAAPIFMHLGKRKAVSDPLAEFDKIKAQEMLPINSIFLISKRRRSTVPKQVNSSEPYWNNSFDAHQTTQNASSLEIGNNGMIAQTSCQAAVLNQTISESRTDLDNLDVTPPELNVDVYNTSWPLRNFIDNLQTTLPEMEITCDTMDVNSPIRASYGDENLIWLSDDYEDIVTLPIKMEIPDEQRNSVTPIEIDEIPRINPLSSVFHRKQRSRTDLPNTTKVAQSNCNQSITKREKRKRFTRKMKLPLSKAIDNNIEKLNNLQADRSDIQKNITNLDQKLNAARKQYIDISEENKRRSARLSKTLKKKVNQWQHIKSDSCNAIQKMYDNIKVKSAKLVEENMQATADRIKILIFSPNMMEEN